MRVRKAVFPAAGWGTRFLPATKAQPKEMLPLVDKPVIQYAVEEAVAAGIEQVIIVTSSQKRAIEDLMVDKLDAQFPGIKAHIVFRETATPLTHTRYTRATDGTGYGLAATPAQFMAGRPGYRGPVPGLYFAGASTRAGHGVLGALNSGKHAANKVLEDRSS